jgi:hypothetical protein
MVCTNKYKLKKKKNWERLESWIPTHEAMMLTTTPLNWTYIHGNLYIYSFIAYYVAFWLRMMFAKQFLATTKCQNVYNK